MTHCPICGAEAGELDRIGDAEGFDCAHHGKFKVSGSVMSSKDAGNREAWERAFSKAKARSDADVWPTIITTDF